MTMGDLLVYGPLGIWLSALIIWAWSLHRRVQELRRKDSQ